MKWPVLAGLGHYEKVEEVQRPSGACWRHSLDGPRLREGASLATGLVR
jgi:hypothetical protein